MNERDLSLIKVIGETVNEQLKQIESRFNEALQAHENKVKGLIESLEQNVNSMAPEPLPDVNALVEEAVAAIPMPAAPQLPDILALVKEAVAEIPAPADGKSVSPEDIRPMLEKMVSDAVEALPAPEIPEIPDIGLMVAEAVAGIPMPQDGKSVSPEDIRPMLEKMVSDAVEALPAPEIPEIPDIGLMVAEAVAGIPMPQDGKSVSPEDIRPMLEKMVSDAVEALPAPEIPEIPDIGLMVAEAVAGIPAPQDGKSVTPEDIRPMLQEMVDKAVATIPDVKALVDEAVKAIPASEPNSPGKPGIDGRDALQLEIIPSIDESKSYPRGSYATHNGGLWRAFEKTHGLRGWECLVDGLAAIDVAQGAQRNFTVTVMRSSGVSESKAFDIPVMIYRGVFKAGETYHAGDTVTWGGSLWHCDEPTADKPGENGSQGWTLAAKRGRDAR
ncbi:phage gp6-like head-tail connector protein [Sodalis ligni]|uniref:Phage portal protein n=1 Tax=Sodalis ligni TaxID=2697027 RepID=A0A4R1NGS9_9GAMM|nr:phage gp6-like head-tail connector protein [Sodalis ligni]TCL06905.1 hypothetical protein EZJ58_5203 [Sodalis ligni]